MIQIKLCIWLKFRWTIHSYYNCKRKLYFSQQDTHSFSTWQDWIVTLVWHHHLSHNAERCAHGHSHHPFRCKSKVLKRKGRAIPHSCGKAPSQQGKLVLQYRLVMGISAPLFVSFRTSIGIFPRLSRPTWIQTAFGALAHRSRLDNDSTHLCRFVYINFENRYSLDRYIPFVIIILWLK